MAASYVARALGQVIGIGLSAPLQQAVLSKDLHSRLAGLVDEDTLQGLIQEPLTILPMLDLATRTQVRLSYMTSIQAVFGFTIVLGVFSTALSVCIKGKRL